MVKTNDLLQIRQLEPQDNRSYFHSDNPEIDRFFINYAGQNQSRHYIGTTYVAMADEKIVGYITVSLGEITAENIALSTCKRLPHYPLPVLRIARLGVDKAFQNKGIGKAMLKAIFKLSVNLRESAGCIGILVDAKIDAVTCYQRFGFIQLLATAGELNERPYPIPMFLSLQIIEKATAK